MFKSINNRAVDNSYIGDCYNFIRGYHMHTQSSKPWATHTPMEPRVSDPKNMNNFSYPQLSINPDMNVRLG